MAENQNIEWKESWRDEYLQWICGFANAQGGRLYIGKDDSGQMIGVSNWRKLMEDLPNIIKNSLDIVVDVNLIEDDGEKKCIEIVVPAYPMPISCKGSCYYRSGSTNQRLTGPQLESFIMSKRSISWDASPLPSFKEDDIDERVVKLFKEKATGKGRLEQNILSEQKMELMDRLHLRNGNYLTNAAALLFSADPEQWFLGAFIKIGFFVSDADLLYQDEVRGSLLEQVDKSLELIYFKYLRAHISYEGVQRKERYPFPLEALREALLNAVVHKDYSRGVPIQVSIYDDKIYIANVGRLPATWTVENLLAKHTSVPFNPNVAHALYLAGYIESWGRGVEKIFNACADDSVPEPKYMVHPEDIMIQFTAPEERVIKTVIEKLSDKLSDKELQILELLIEDPAYTSREMAKKLGASHVTVMRRLRRLKDKGVVQRVGTNRIGHWEIMRKEADTIIK